MTDIEEAPSPAPPSPRSLARRAFRSAMEWILILGVALLVAVLARTFLVATFYIPSASMDPQLAVGDRVLVNKLSYRLHGVNRGDIVVFDRPDCDQSQTGIQDLIKRAVAFEGERVEAQGGKVLVDGEPIDEPYLPEGRTTSDFGPVEIPADHVWVMGDNRGNSEDSRFLCGGNTPIPEENIEGRAFVRFFPFDRFEML